MSLPVVEKARLTALAPEIVAGAREESAKVCSRFLELMDTLPQALKWNSVPFIKGLCAATPLGITGDRIRTPGRGGVTISYRVSH